MSYIRLAKNKDKESILSLYQSLIGISGCTWSMKYPYIEEVQHDIENSSLYCICDNTDSILAVAAAGNDNELDHLLWNDKMKNPCELARVAVNQSKHNLGLGYAIVEYVIKDVKKRGFDGIRMLVSKSNPSALALYEKFNFHRCGETRMYDIEFFCYEMVLED
jgi:ribosomal protein S18 acetylase RimI-like enzyme